MVACTSLLSYSGKHKRRITVQVSLGKCKTLSPKQPEQKGLEVWLKWQNSCLASTKSEFSTTKTNRKFGHLDFFILRKR
jgi:hypothetical protein